MSGYGYPHNNPYGAGPPPNQPYGAPPPTAQPYGAPPPTAHPYQPSPGSGYPSHDPYGKPQKDNYSSYPTHDPNKPQKDNYPGYPTHDPYAKPDNKPQKDNYSGSGYPTHDPYGKPDKPQKDNYSGYPTHDPYGKPDSYGKPQKDNYGQGYPSAPPQPHGGSGSGSGYPSAPPQGGGGQGYGAFAALMPSTFAPGTDPTIIACFQVADQDGSGIIDDKELQRALSGYNQSFSLHTVHLLMLNFTSSNSRKIGPKEFTALFYALQSWREIFERFDKDRSGRIDAPELRDALYSLGFAVSPVILDLLVSKFDKSGGKNKAIEYDNFIECCLTVKGLTEKFKEKDTQYRGSATFTYEEFMLTVLPYLVA